MNFDPEELTLEDALLIEENRSGFIYIIHAKETGFYKIGITWRSAETRRQHLQSGCMYDLEVTYSKKVDDCEVIEKELHECLKKYRRRGEWYELPDNWSSELPKELWCKLIVLEEIISCKETVQS